ncbi:MAG: hypothetical protein R2778_10320 [Saprospiraceae bacterium]
MQFNIFKISRALLIMLTVFTVIISACKKEEIYEKTRLFRPVLNEELTAIKYHYREYGQYSRSSFLHS